MLLYVNSIVNTIVNSIGDPFPNPQIVLISLRAGLDGIHTYNNYNYENTVVPHAEKDKRYRMHYLALAWWRGPDCRSRANRFGPLCVLFGTSLMEGP